MYWDAHTQTYMTPHRHFNPRTGRWTQPDPLWNIHNMIFGSNPVSRNGRLIPNSNAIMQSGNLYVFVMNNSVMFVDPTGLFATTPREDRSQIHNAVVREIVRINSPREIFINVAIKDGQGKVKGFADIIANTGHVFDVKSATSIAQPYQLRNAQAQVLRYTQGHPNLDFGDVGRLREGVLDMFNMSGEVAVEANRGFYHIEFSQVPRAPQIIQYTYSSMTRQEFIDFQDARGLLSNADRRRLEGRGTPAQAVLSVIQQVPAIISPMIPRLPGF